MKLRVCTYENEKAGAQRHDFIRHPVHLGSDHGCGTKDAAGEGNAEGQCGIEDCDCVFLGQLPVVRILRVIGPIPAHHVVLPLGLSVIFAILIVSFRVYSSLLQVTT